jgi:hypothetical protein
MGETVFLLGAGFNLDANSILPSVDFSQPGRMVGLTHDNCPSWELADIPLRYPTVNELVRYCFGPDVDLSLGAERLFTEAYSRSDWVVLRRLTTIIQGADHYIATPLAGKDSVYSRFFSSFAKSTFISYNYDCLAELCLQAQGSWNPQSGFGVPAEVWKHGFPMGPEPMGDLGSSTEIFHVHGSLYLYPVLSDLNPPDRDGMQWLTMRPDPRFLFDPDSLGSSFPRYGRPSPGHGYSVPEERFIPPIAEKAESIEQDYYAVLFGRAVERVRTSHRIIAIGYSFASSDRPSYDPFLRELFSHSGSLLVVSPWAQDLSMRIMRDYQSYSPIIEFLPMTFSQWVNAAYPKGSERI